MTRLLSIDDACQEAARLLAETDGLLITAGAGMGVDSGLPDFRSEQGFWATYPALGKLGTRFFEIANPKAFRNTPELAWGFYGHRYKLYRDTSPHAGFARLLQLSRRIQHGAFVFTSNVDGQFEKAGFSPARVAACHGTIHRMQCLDNCGCSPWVVQDFEPQVDEAACQLLSPLPTCPQCGALARPNVLMFGDSGWDAQHAERQQGHLHAWLARVKRPVVLEIGAGSAIPTVRLFGEEVDAPLIRVNPAESRVAQRRDVAIPTGALDGLTRICDALEQR